MRWPFSRRRPAPTVAGPRTRSEPAAWRSLPPIQRAVERIEPSAHSEEFTHDLGIRRPLEHFLEPLGHDVRTEAPSGIATGIAAPAVSRTEGPELDFTSPERRREPGAAAATAPRRPLAQRAPEPASPLPGMAPIRTLPTVQRAPEAAPAESPQAHEREPEIVPELPLGPNVARAAGGESPPVSEPGAGASEEEIPEVQRAPASDAPLVGRRLGLGEPLTARPPTASETPPPHAADRPLSSGEKKDAGARAAESGRSTGSLQMAADAPGSEKPTEEVAPVAGETRPLASKTGILRSRSERGAEIEASPEALQLAPSKDSILRGAVHHPPEPRRLTALPAEPSRKGADAAAGSDSLQRAELPLPPAPPATQRAPEEGHSSTEPPAAPSPAGEAEDDIVPEPSRGLVGQVPTAKVTSGFQGAPADVTGQAAPPLPASATAPLVSARRLAPVQRASETPPEPVRKAVERSTGVALSGVTIHREAASATAARQMSARAFTTGGEVHVPTHHGPLDGGEGRALVAHELVHVAQQRRLGPALPAESTSEGRRLEGEARSMESTWRSAPEMPLVSRAPAPERETPAPVIDPGAAAVAAGIAQRQPDGSVSFHTPEGAAPQGVQRLEDTMTATAAAPEAPAERSEEDLDELADKLYEPLSRRLRQDLISERERAGRLADVG